MFAQRNGQGRRRGARRHQSQVFRPVIEAMEGRVLLSGEVTTTPTGTPDSPGEETPVLEILGDELANEVMVKSGNAPGEIIVSGLNGTLVNGSTQEWHFRNVEQIGVFLNGGDDVFDARDLEFSSQSLANLVVDGGTGDDRITVFNFSIDANAPADGTQSSVEVGLAGDTTNPGTGASSGNDIIDVSNTTIFAQDGETAGAVLQIFGDLNRGGNVTGGNDRISVTNTDITATNASLSNQAFVEVYGDFNHSNDPEFPGTPISTIGQGNDSISIDRTTITADNSEAFGGVIFQIVGEDNEASGAGASASVGGGNDSISVTNTQINAVTAAFTDPRRNNPDAIVQVLGEFNRPTGGATASIGGGNDNISLTNTTVSATGSDFQNTATVNIQGDNNYSPVPNTATVGGGNDTILVNGFVVTAFGGNFQNSAELDIFGDGDYSTEHNVLLLGPNQGRIGGGRDTVSVLNTDVSATGGSFDDVAVLQVFGDDGPTTNTIPPGGEPFPTTVLDGDDDVKLSNVLVRGDVPPPIFNGGETLRVDTRTGDDVVTVLNSSFGGSRIDLGDGNDSMTFNGNSFISAFLEGGTGFDTLNAHGNSPGMVFSGFERVNFS